MCIISYYINILWKIVYYTVMMSYIHLIHLTIIHLNIYSKQMYKTFIQFMLHITILIILLFNVNYIYTCVTDRLWNTFDKS